jgi:hypothetical protein
VTEERARLPEGWVSVVAEIERRYRRVVSLAPAPGAFDPEGRLVEVTVDGKLVGSFEFTWDPARPLEAVLRELRDQIEELCAEELGSGR